MKYVLNTLFPNKIIQKPSKPIVLIIVLVFKQSTKNHNVKLALATKTLKINYIPLIN